MTEEPPIAYDLLEEPTRIMDYEVAIPLSAAISLKRIADVFDFFVAEFKKDQEAGRV